ncbi:hypothetical protein BJ741DRAFT_609666 [Chytriomyces cf. hyalinus JEL632]|nr:hypothetical protein BJ741DRAFT_609666 [Chytriomyces cf. hyalinus JEL632]
MDTLLARAETIQQRISSLKQLLTETSTQSGTHNLDRLSSLVRAEQNHMRSLGASSSPENTSGKPSKSDIALQCSNIPFFEAVLDIAESAFAATGSVSVLQNVLYLPQEGTAVESKVAIDVMSGTLWVKARAGTVLSSLVDGNFEFDDSDSESEAEDTDNDECDSPAIPLDHLNVSKPTELENIKAHDRASSNSPLRDFSSLRIMKQAQALVSAAAQNLFHFKTPAVVYCFMGQAVSPNLEESLFIDALRLLGVTVCLGTYECNEYLSQSAVLSSRDSQSNTCSASPMHSIHPSSYVTQNVNLDITTLVSIVSDTCHCFETIPKAVFDVDALKLQALQEADCPLLSQLEPILAPRDLFVTKTAFTRFMNLTDKIAGEREKRRTLLLFSAASLDAEDSECLQRVAKSVVDVNSEQDINGLMHPLSEKIICRRIRIVPDAPSGRFLQFASNIPSVSNSATGPSACGNGNGKRKKQYPISTLKLSDANIAIFGTGDAMQCTTLTANVGLVRSFAMNMKGVSVCLHQPRSLIEARRGGY